MNINTALQPMIHENTWCKEKNKKNNLLQLPAANETLVMNQGDAR